MQLLAIPESGFNFVPIYKIIQTSQSHPPTRTRAPHPPDITKPASHSPVVPSTPESKPCEAQQDGYPPCLGCELMGPQSVVDVIPHVSGTVCLAIPIVPGQEPEGEEVMKAGGWITEGKGGWALHLGPSQPERGLCHQWPTKVGRPEKKPGAPTNWCCFRRSDQLECHSDSLWQWLSGEPGNSCLTDIYWINTIKCFNAMVSKCFMIKLFANILLHKSGYGGNHLQQKALWKQQEMKLHVQYSFH